MVLHFLPTQARLCQMDVHGVCLQTDFENNLKPFKAVS